MLCDVEIKVLIGLASLGGIATISEVSKFLGMDEGYVRNVMNRLEKKGVVVKFSSATSYGLYGGRSERGKLRALSKDLGKIVDEHPEIIEWFKRSAIIDERLREVVEGISGIEKKEDVLESSLSLNDILEIVRRLKGS